MVMIKKKKRWLRINMCDQQILVFWKVGGCSVGRERVVVVVHALLSTFSEDTD